MPLLKRNETNVTMIEDVLAKKKLKRRKRMLMKVITLGYSSELGDDLA